ncbi:MAG: efflux RND transporter periplasmic adaptor subunit [Chlamydiota bacterium]
MRKQILFFALFASCSSGIPEKTLSPYPVKVIKAIKKDVPIYLETIGHVEPILQVQIASRVEGEITGVYFHEGEEVRKGDLLFTIDPRTFQADVQKAQGALQERVAQIDIAREKVLRYSPLTEEDYYARIQFDELKSNLHALEGTLLQAKASLKSAEIALGYCWIYAPVTGRTGKLQIDQGNIVKSDASQTLVTINQIRPIYVSFFFPQKYLAKIQHWQTELGSLRTLVSTDGFEKKIFHGPVDMIDNEVDQDTGTIALRALFENKTEELWPGRYVRVRLVLRIEKEALTLPQAAIQYDTKGPFVFTVTEEQTIMKRPLTLGQRLGKEVLVKRGLTEGEEVVTLGGQNLFTGARVSVKEVEGL